MRKIIALLMLVPFVTGCTSLFGHPQTRQGASSSLVDFLYPNGEIPARNDGPMPHLALPARVGIAFVPSNSQWDVSAAEKQELLDQVAAAFRDRDYVESIETISDVYLRSSKGVNGLRQVAAMHGVDIMALVSYDQISFSSERESAILYWTIVGTAMVKGNSNEVRTMIDTAVFDVQTAKLLFRAPGVHQIQRNSTMLGSERDLYALRSEGMAAANQDMIVNLNHELETFRAAVKQGEEAQVAWTNGGGGGTGLLFVVLLGLLSAVRLRFRRTVH